MARTRVHRPEGRWQRAGKQGDLAVLMPLRLGRQTFDGLQSLFKSRLGACQSPLELFDASLDPGSMTSLIFAEPRGVVSWGDFELLNVGFVAFFWCHFNTWASGIGMCRGGREALSAMEEGSRA